MQRLEKFPSVEKILVIRYWRYNREIQFHDLNIFFNDKRKYYLLFFKGGLQHCVHENHLKLLINYHGKIEIINIFDGWKIQELWNVLITGVYTQFFFIQTHSLLSH